MTAKEPDSRAENDFDKFPTLKELRGQIKNRSEIQLLIAELFDLGRNKEAHAILESHEELNRAYSLIAGAAFSLWRAAFLTNADENRGALLDGCINYLGIVVRDNAIGFPQDRDARAWTVGFYLNSAASRLGVLSKMSGFAADGTLKQYEAVNEALIAWDQPRRMWEHIMMATRCAFECLEQAVKQNET